MKSAMLLMAVIVFSACSSAPVNAQAEKILTGNEVFNKNCAQCHSPGIAYPGTQQLGRTRGEQYAVLEERTDLTEVYIEFVVRNGLSAMTPFLPTEVTEEELINLTEYLTAK